MGVEAVGRQVFEGREETEPIGVDPVEQCAASPADGAVADPDVVQLRVDLEPDAAAMA
jgi:hypothetical protein